MTCLVCGGYGENIGTPDSPILVHRETGDCWEGGFHAYAVRGRQAGVEAADRAFKVQVEIRPNVFAAYFPWDLPRGAHR